MEGDATCVHGTGLVGCTNCFALYWGNGGDGGVCPVSEKHLFGFNYSVILLI